MDALIDLSDGPFKAALDAYKYGSREMMRLIRRMSVERVLSSF